MTHAALSELVQAYQALASCRSQDDLEFYASLPELAVAIDYSVRAVLRTGKRHPHQHRLKAAVLREVSECVQANRMGVQQCGSFQALIELVRGCAVPGFGELAVYDAALRLGAYLGHWPEQVYLHAGTRKGAAALGLPVDREALAMSELPAPLRAMKPHDVENFLCIYNDQLGATK